MKAKVLLILVVLSGITAFLNGCGKGDPPENAELIISPTFLNMNDSDVGTFYLSVQPAYEFSWEVTTNPDWLDITPSSGIVDDDLVKITVTPQTEGMSPSTLFGRVEILSNGAGKVAFEVYVTVDGNPKIKITPSKLEFDQEENTKTVTIENAGTGFLFWNFSSLPSWMSSNVESGDLLEGEQMELTVNVNRNGLSEGTINEIITIEHNGVDSPEKIDVSMDVPAIAIIKTSIEALNFDFFQDEETFYIRNDGNINLDWSWDNSSNPFLSASPDNGSVAVGDSIEVTVSVDRTDLVSQVYDLEIPILNNGGDNYDLPVSVSHYLEEKWLIEDNIIDAEYDKVNDMIVVVTESPYELRKYDVTNETVSTVSLDLKPTCVAVGLDGNYAAVGHDGRVTYVDLMSMTKEQVYSVTTCAWDIILAPNSWVYVFPKDDQWERIRCIDMSTGEETLHIGNSIYDRTKVKLHPSGNYIYGADNGLSPSDFEKYDIQNGTAEYLYDSPYHGTYSFAGNIWISEDGQRLFARSRNVFNATTTQNSDMTYSGNLSGEGAVFTLDTSTEAGLIFAVLSKNGYNEPPVDKIRVYDLDFLTLQTSIDVPGFLIPNGNGGGDFYKSEGYFGFFNSDGTKFHLLVKVQAGSGLSNEWAIVTKDVSKCVP